MPTERKANTISDLQELWGSSLLAILTEYRGLTVAELTKLRTDLRPKGAEYHVTKNTLLLRAANQLGYSGLDEALAGPTAVVFIKEDLAGGSKAVLDFAKNNNKIVVKQGILNGQLLDAARLEAITKLPSKNQLIANMLGSLQAPTRNLVTVLSATTRNLVNVLDQYRQKLEGQGQEGAANA
ncbi:MAG TPA: 50S ribosomal protein L10 [Chloroflexia bacterium]|nr:50S ribosomal protein L10 [Chloroflexia bacterium]